ncbi:MAG: SIMPL domain-containing protein [bacterium]|nr:SIMPL domain-containing protein [bacterium]
MRQTIVVTVVAMDGLEDVLSSALEAGANQVHGIEFRSSNPRKHMDEARNQALDAATEKAKAMAGRPRIR